MNPFFEFALYNIFKLFFVGIWSPSRNGKLLEDKEETFSLINVHMFFVLTVYSQTVKYNFLIIYINKIKLLILIKN